MVFLTDRKHLVIFLNTYKFVYMELNLRGEFMWSKEVGTKLNAWLYNAFKRASQGSFNLMSFSIQQSRRNEVLRAQRGGGQQRAHSVVGAVVTALTSLLTLLKNTFVKFFICAFDKKTQAFQLHIDETIIAIMGGTENAVLYTYPSFLMRFLFAWHAWAFFWDNTALWLNCI